MDIIEDVDVLLEELRVLGFDYSVDEYGTCANIIGDVIFTSDTLEETSEQLQFMLDEIRNERRMAWSD